MYSLGLHTKCIEIYKPTSKLFIDTRIIIANMSEKDRSRIEIAD